MRPVTHYTRGGHLGQNLLLFNYTNHIFLNIDASFLNKLANNTQRLVLCPYTRCSTAVQTTVKQALVFIANQIIDPRQLWHSSMLLSALFTECSSKPPSHCVSHNQNGSQIKCYYLTEGGCQGDGVYITKSGPVKKALGEICGMAVSDLHCN